MSKLMSSLVAATVVGALSMSAIAAEAARTTPVALASAAEKPSATPQKAKKQIKKHETKTEQKSTGAAAPAPARK